MKSSYQNTVYTNVTNAIERMMYKRYEKTHDKEKVKQHLEHLKRDVWMNSKGICEFIDGCIVKLENIKLKGWLIMKIKNALKNESISYRDFYSALQNKSIGNWDDINSTDIIQEYVFDMMKQGVHVGHIVTALEENYSKHDDWCIWLGNSMETPTPINSKQDLVDALQLDEEDLNKNIKFKN